MLAAFAGATTTEVERVLLRLLARLGVEDELAYRYPAIVAGVGVLVLVVGCCVEGIAGWRYSVLVHSLYSISVGRVPGCVTTCGAISVSTHRVNYLNLEVNTF